MALQFSTGVRNARLDVIESTILAAGAVATIRFYSGAMPANCAAAATGTLLCQINLPSGDFMAAAANGSKAKTGTWTGTGEPAASTGTNVGYFRVYDAAGTPVCHMQGTVTATGGGGDMTLDNVNVASGQTVTVTGFTLNEGNA